MSDECEHPETMRVQKGPYEIRDGFWCSVCARWIFPEVKP